MTVLLTAGFLLALTPATISQPIVFSEILVGTAGLTAMVILNVFLLRRATEPLWGLTSLMRRVDLLSPGERLPITGETLETDELGRVFNAMLDRLEEERRRSTGRLVAAQEEERRRVARELHDEISQTLTGVMLRIGGLAAQSEEPARTALLEIQDEARSVVTEVGEIVRRLRPEELEHLGLVTALTGLTSRLSDSSEMTIHRRLEGGLPALPEAGELAIYRIAQEALTNALRHSRASNVELSLERCPVGVRLSVADDGVGLPDEVGWRSSGIRGMRERALLVGAELQLLSEPGGGTLVQLTLPVGREEQR